MVSQEYNGNNRNVLINTSPVKQNSSVWVMFWPDVLPHELIIMAVFLNKWMNILLILQHLWVRCSHLLVRSWVIHVAYSMWVYLTKCDSILTVQMISAEAPVLFAKAAQIFITELTLRAWIHTEDNKRRTLQVRYTRRGVWPLFSSSFYSFFTCSSMSDRTCVSLPLSWFFTYLYSTTFFFSTLLTPVSPCIILVCHFYVQNVLVSVCPIPASPWGISLCLVLSPSIDFESKAMQAPVTHFSLRCHFACSAVPKLNKMDSGNDARGKRKLGTWERWWEQLGKSD